MSYLNRHKFILSFLLLSTVALSQDYDGTLEEDVYIKLDVTSCYGHCPAFSVTIEGDGSVAYKGVEYVAKLGEKAKHISKKKIAHLISSIFNIQFFQRTDTSNNCYTNTKLTYDGNYETSNLCYLDSHGSSVVITVKFGSYYREVSLEHYYSDDYKHLKDQIIETVGIKRWIKRKK